MKNLGLWFLLVAACGGSNSKSGDDDDTVDGGNRTDSMVLVDAAPAPDAFVCTANIQSDPNNCGACGRSCLGSSCTAGMCTTERMDGGEATGYGDVHTDNLFIYYTAFISGVSPHRIWRRPIGSGNVSYVGVLSTPTPISEMAFVSDNFYIAEPNRIDTQNRGIVKKINKEPFTETPLANFLEPTTTAVVESGGFVYWATDVDGANGGDIKKVSTAGGAASAVTVAAGTVDYMKINATNIYWVGGGQLKRAALPSGTPVAMGATTSKTFEIDATRVYTINGGTIVATPLGGGGQVTLGGAGLTQGVSADDDYVYAAQAGNKLVAVPKAGGSAIQMWTEPAIDAGNGCFLNYKISRVKVIGQYVYFSAPVINSCGNTLSSEGLYRTPRM